MTIKRVLLCGASLFLLSGSFNPSTVTNLPSIAALRAGNFTNITTLNVTGYYAGTTLGSGTFAACTHQTDNGGTVINDAAGNSFCRQGVDFPLPVSIFGVYSDWVTTPADATVSAGSTDVTSIKLPCTAADVTTPAKVIEFSPGGVDPFTTTISACNGTHYVLAHAAPNAYPGTMKSSSATWDPSDDVAGSGYAPGTTLTATGGTFTSAATATVRSVQVVAFNATPVSAGTSYTANDVLTCDGSGGGTNEKFPVQLQVLTLGGGGAVATWSILSGGSYRKFDPTTFSCTGGTGSGFQPALLASNGSFGLWEIVQVSKGAYTVLPGPNNDGTQVPVTDSGSGTGGTADFNFSVPDWSKGHEDTTALQNAETFAEGAFKTTMRGLTPTLLLPQGTQTLTCGNTINAAVAWKGGGILQTRLVLGLGCAGAVVGSSPKGLLVVAPQYPSGDSYSKDGYGQAVASIEGMTLSGVSLSPTYDKDASTNLTAPNVSGLVATGATGHRPKSPPLYLEKVQFARFTGGGNGVTVFQNAPVLRFHDVNVTQIYSPNADFTGTSHTSTTIDGISGGNITSITAACQYISPCYVEGPGIVDGTTVASIGASSITLSVAAESSVTDQFTVYGGGNGIDLGNGANPFLFDTIIVSAANICLNSTGGKQFELSKMNLFGCNKSLSLTGWSDRGSSTINLSHVQLNEDHLECMFLGTQNTVVHMSDVRFDKCNQGGAVNTNTSPADADLVISYNAQPAGSGANCLEVDKATFNAGTTDYNVLGTASPAAAYSTCNVTMKGTVQGTSISSTPSSLALLSDNDLFGRLLNKNLFSLGNDFTFNSSCLWQVSGNPDINLTNCNKGSYRNIYAKNVNLSNGTVGSPNALSLGYNGSGSYSYNFPNSAGSTGQALTYGSPGTWSSFQSSLQFGSGNSTNGGGATVYYACGGNVQLTSAPTNTMPYGGTIKNLYVRASAAPGGVQTQVFTVFVNGSSTSVTATLLGAAVSASDVVHTASFSAGQSCYIQEVASATASAAQLGGSIEVDTP